MSPFASRLRTLLGISDMSAAERRKSIARAPHWHQDTTYSHLRPPTDYKSTVSSGSSSASWGSDDDTLNTSIPTTHAKEEQTSVSWISQPSDSTRHSLDATSSGTTASPIPRAGSSGLQALPHPPATATPKAPIPVVAAKPTKTLTSPRVTASEAARAIPRPRTKHTQPVPPSRDKPVPSSRDTLVPSSSRDMRLPDVSDHSAIQILLAIIHDCILFTQDLQRGLLPLDFFTGRFRYISLYIFARDLEAFKPVIGKLRFQALGDLVGLRKRTLFGTRAELNTARRGRGRLERKVLREAISLILKEAPVPHRLQGEGYLMRLPTLILNIDQHLAGFSTRRAPVTEDIKHFLKIRPEEASNGKKATIAISPILTPRRELNIISDIVCALSGLTWTGFRMPDRTGLVSLSTDPPNVAYSSGQVPERTRLLTFARDVLCGFLPGPSILTAEGAFTILVKPVMTSPSVHYFYGVMSPAERDFLNSGTLLPILVDFQHPRWEVWRKQECVDFLINRLNNGLRRRYSVCLRHEPWRGQRIRRHVPESRSLIL